MSGRDGAEGGAAGGGPPASSSSPRRRAGSSETLLPQPPPAAPLPPDTSANSGYASEETASLIARDDDFFESASRTDKVAERERGRARARELAGGGVYRHRHLLATLPPPSAATSHEGPVCLTIGPDHEEPEEGGPQTEAARSVPDIELHCRRGDTAEAGRALEVSGLQGVDASPSTCRARAYLLPHAHSRCRCDRTLLPLARSVSRESVRSAHGVPAVQGAVVPSSSVLVSGGASGGGDVTLPVVLTSLSSSRDGSSTRIIRQSSQPESSCSHCNHPPPTASLRQLREPGDGIAGIAADSLRINGAIRQFKQGILLCPQTLAQTRRTRFRRAFTDATSETVTYVKTV
ncbi:small conductance calcium-activated potassium channel protein-like [Ischnura elegans]|uniref:small conductance calcium-activated potassium channel protein-like n=1 Tax=Ischnura elegans TaxID=197161 RepID=UPI001ED8A572|nr:small conductance calcium-activated potassium channel protein-like [Ischnura elegans]